MNIYKIVKFYWNSDIFDPVLSMAVFLLPWQTWVVATIWQTYNNYYLAFYGKKKCGCCCRFHLVDMIYPSMHVANILFKNFLFPNQWLPVNSNASALGNSISYFSKCVPCKWWLIMPLIRKRGDALLSIKCKANLGRCCRIKTTAAHIFRKLMFYLVSSGRSSSPSGHQAPKLSNPESQKQSVRFLAGRRVCSSVKAQTTVCALCSELVDTHLTKKTLTGHKVHLIIYMCWVNETFLGRKHKLEFPICRKDGNN